MLFGVAASGKELRWKPNRVGGQVERNQGVLRNVKVDTNLVLYISASLMTQINACRDELISGQRYVEGLPGLP
jgi:hypothetical protein